ncbi:hypothetical protein GFK26_18640 [Variovorax paradoxus]|uniref:Uncharacterized protein n=1 Tax=Variovorax paradoxus TaxID=34073 RepID=A0A5Q0M5C8_VARPD|nr:hypothetical protein [Variovorax paradoxus]QFZ84646.1 hypothetical protein GFK26_18640 [Variovorax paradoxus]
MKELLLFGSAFGAVFLLGFQSLAVNSGYRALALVNSALIGVMNIGLFKLVPHVETMTQAVIYVGAGPLAILCAMEVHAWMRRRKAV